MHRGLLGVTVQGVTGDLAAGLGLNKAEGALVSGVTPGGAADKAGLKRGDVIMSYQGRAVVDTNAFRNEIAATKPGTTITLGVLRDGRNSEFKATLSENADADKAGRDTEGRRDAHVDVTHVVLDDSQQFGHGGVSVVVRGWHGVRLYLVRVSFVRAVRNVAVITGGASGKAVPWSTSACRLGCLAIPSVLFATARYDHAGLVAH